MGTLMKNNIHFCSYLTQFFLEREMFQVKFVGTIETHFMFKNIFFLNIVPFVKIIWKNIEEPEKP